ncbi:MAG: cytochrome c3 family protein [Desulfobacteraceae bacterium]|nr:cytochrome c3 family protein [Desulfobacteraceae bacterium]
MKRMIWLMVASIMIFGTGIAIAELNSGPEELTIDGGDRGNVPFPHRKHQTNLKDCNICHAVFPQKTGAIAEMKAQGKLKQKDVMNKQCTKCHRNEKKAGNPSGPTTCAKCHMKKG